MNSIKTESLQDSKALTPESIAELVVAALEDAKGIDIIVLDVRDKTSITDYMIIVSGTSSRHIKTLANGVVLKSKQKGIGVLGTEGDSGSEWMLVDLGDVLLHVMLPQTRSYYNLEGIWRIDQPDES